MNHRTRNIVLIGATVAIGAAISLGFVPSVRRYIRMKRM